MIACGLAEGRFKPPGNVLYRVMQDLLPAPLTYGGTDVDLITGGETSPNVTQSETFTWANPDNPNNLIVTYNDSYRCEKISTFLRKKS